MATYSSILAWRMPRTEEPGGLQSTGSQRVGHDWATFTSLLHFKYMCVCVCVCVCVYKALWNDLEPYWIIRATYNKAQWRTEVEVTSSGNPLYNPRGCQYSDCVLQQHSRWCTLSLRRPPSTGRGSINEAEWVNEVDAGKQNFILMPYSAYLMGSDDPQFQHYQNQ